MEIDVRDGNGLSLFMVTQAYSQGTSPATKGKKSARTQSRRPTQSLPGHELTGMTVKDKANQSIGQIQDLVIDESGQVQYLAVNTHVAGREPARPELQQPQPGRPGNAARTDDPERSQGKPRRIRMKN